MSGGPGCSERVTYRGGANARLRKEPFVLPGSDLFAVSGGFLAGFVRYGVGSEVLGAERRYLFLIGFFSGWG